MIFIAAANGGSTALPIRRCGNDPYIGHQHTLLADHPMLQPDLFERPWVAGLAFQPDLITREVETELIARIDAIDLAPFRFQGWLGKRVTASFG